MLTWSICSTLLVGRNCFFKQVLIPVFLSSSNRKSAYQGVSVKFTMSQEIIQRLENNASKAESLIADIYNKIADIQKASNKPKHPEMDQLRGENELLKQEIAKYKELLLIREIRNGGNPVVLDPKVSVPSGNQSAADSQASTTAWTVEEVPVTKEDSQAAPSKKAKCQPTSGQSKDVESGDKAKAPKQSNKKPAAPADGGSTEVVDVGRLDFRVGKIVEVSRHPDADSLYLEKIDIGEANPRTVVSGLVKFVPIEQMENRMVILLCNLKPAKMRGVTSEAMVMCASTPEKVEVLIPPTGAVPGDVVDVEGFVRNPDPVLAPKKKIFETVAPDLKTNDQKQATYKGIPWTVKGKGVVVTESLCNVIIK